VSFFFQSEILLLLRIERNGNKNIKKGKRKDKSQSPNISAALISFVPAQTPAATILLVSKRPNHHGTRNLNKIQCRKELIKENNKNNSARKSKMFSLC